MARCEDFPCCGHESGCCPDYDESGRQMNMRCVCGAVLPINNRYSICESCLSEEDDGECCEEEPVDEDGEGFYEDDEFFEDEGDFGEDGWLDGRFDE